MFGFEKEIGKVERPDAQEPIFGASDAKPFVEDQCVNGACVAGGEKKLKNQLDIYNDHR